MNTFVRFLQFLSLGIWLGSILYFGAIVAPAAFAVLQSDQAGVLIGLTLGRLHLMGMVAGIVYLLATQSQSYVPVVGWCVRLCWCC